MSEFFLELFSEEIPAGLQKNLREKLLEELQKFFIEKSLLNNELIGIWVLIFSISIVLSLSLNLGPTVFREKSKFIGFKIFLHPIIAILIIWNLNEIEFSISETTIMVASAPVGLMALIFSTQYDVNPNAITRALLITTLLSVISIPLVSTLS